MPPRLEVLQRLGTVNLCLRPAARPATPNFLPVIQTANLSQRERKRKAKQDPYKWAQAQQRKNANLKRREELQKQRDEAWGNPVLGKTTPFLESLDTAGQVGLSEVFRDPSGNALQTPHELPTTPGLRNHFLTDAELEEATKHAFTLSKPMTGIVSDQFSNASPNEAIEKHKQDHAKAIEALKRITSLRNGSGKDRFHANVRRLVDEFGRHKTDKFLEPRPQSISPNTTPMPARAGPDTGSSEVQIAILTAKIRTLSKALQINRGYKDHHNKRNLRLLVHRRQKLLAYMERKERGSERWTHMIEKLGLTPATWKGQIDL
ncbi:ribosomal protein S15 precursor-like protein [Pochonia chlamydosporia 170]|uniref:Ribosomal protein S15-like protein n=1 Tax=Pochonia chlamydosporia 170 TaxID=1380566 RepID=A0A179G5Z2_METCM|nr:ribosomal protein S15 precursor-like protein [Pochonia chlamydosporia 170]OAQ73244.1 ribosomal protein S15 precursor-like protein [Pochonia chlamydosporia 170]